MINKDKKDRVVRQFVTYCRMALRYEKINYYNERKRMVSDGKLMETQTANYFSDIYPIDCAVLSANA